MKRETREKSGLHALLLILINEYHDTMLINFTARVVGKASQNMHFLRTL